MSDHLLTKLADSEVKKINSEIAAQPYIEPFSDADLEVKKIMQQGKMYNEQRRQNERRSTERRP